jgi:TetR/AcrR family transcriptional regulator, transcriptional repressor of aconitase
MADWKRARELRRQEIVEAACRCFARRGVHRTTIRDVQREAGLSAGAVYAYFPNKEELRRAATAMVMTSVVEILGKALRDSGDATPVEAAASAANALTAGDTPVELVFDLLLAARWDAQAAANVRTALDRAHGECVTAARRMAGEGRVSPGTGPETTGTTLLHLTFGALAVRLPAPDDVPPQGFIRAR